MYILIKFLKIAATDSPINSLDDVLRFQVDINEEKPNSFVSSGNMWIVP